MKPPSIARAWARIAGCGLLLAGCHSAPTRIYTLYPVASTAAVTGYSGPALRVDAVHMPPSLDRIEVVSDVTPGELKIHDTEHWSAPLGQVAKQALSADLMSRLPSGRVVFPHLSKPDGALGLSVDVLEFSADAQGSRLIGSWAIGASGDAAQGRRGTATLQLERSTAGSRDTAETLSRLLGLLADRIVADL